MVFHNHLIAEHFNGSRLTPLNQHVGRRNFWGVFGTDHRVRYSHPMENHHVVESTCKCGAKLRTTFKAATAGGFSACGWSPRHCLEGESQPLPGELVEFEVMKEGKWIPTPCL
jgi:hypothetical protein